MRSTGWILSGVAMLTGIQALLFYDYFAVALTVMVGLGIGIWLRHWTAGFWSLASFLTAFYVAAFSGWLGEFREVADPLLGGVLAFLGGLIGGGVFDLVRGETATGEAPGVESTR